MEWDVAISWQLRDIRGHYMVYVAQFGVYMVCVHPVTATKTQ